ncbi:mitochondrial carrier domain-containing protein [Dipodascopsis uninucleata]
MPTLPKFPEDLNQESPKDKDERIQLLFHSLDKKNLGFLDKDAISEVFDSARHSLASADELVSDIIAMVDANGDGKIEYEEFKTFVQKAEYQLWNLFIAIDRDNSGLLDKDEVADALENAGLQVSKERLEQFFDSMDKDRDGAISFKDWTDYFLFLPIEKLSIKAAYRYFISYRPMNTEGDVVINDDTSNDMGYFLAGGIAGAISRTATAPFDRLKVYLIAHVSEVPHIAKKKSVPGIRSKIMASSIVQATKAIWAERGIRSFFVDSINILKIFPESAIKFGSFETAKKVLANIEGTTISDMSGISSFLAGGIGGTVSQFAVYPVDTLKFRLQCESESSSLRGNALLVKTAKDMWRTEGFKAYYRGLALGLAGIFPFAALDLGTFEAMKRGYVKAKSKQLSVKEEEISIGNMLVLTMGAISGSIGATAVYPINVLRTRLQTQGTAAHPQRYSGVNDVLQQLLRNEGYRGLFRGLLPNLIKVAPAVSISYVAYENCKNIMNLP